MKCSYCCEPFRDTDCCELFRDTELTYVILQTHGCIFRFHTQCALHFILGILSDDGRIWNEHFLGLEYDEK